MPDRFGSNWSRRDVLAAATTGLFGMLATGCTPIRVVLGAYPERFKNDLDLDTAVLRAFADAVIPGVDRDDPNLIRAFTDKAYPFARYGTFFCSDLSARAYRLHGDAAFERLDRDQRTAVIKHGLVADAVTRKLYTGAIFFAQVAVYSAIYDDAHGAPLIDFDGRYRFAGLDAVSHPCPETYLARSITLDGNPA